MEIDNTNISFITRGLTIPTDLELDVDGITVFYERIFCGFRFDIYTKDEEVAMTTARKIVNRMKYEHDEPELGISWSTISLEVVPQDDPYKVSTVIEWKYRVRDSY